MIQPAKKDVGRSVIYKPTGQEGGITSFNDTYVFVRFRDRHPTAGGKSCKLEDLKWSHPEDGEPTE